MRSTLLDVAKHTWVKVSGRTLRCSSCELRAHAKSCPATRRPYTVWQWEGNSWDSRNSSTPACPPYPKGAKK